MHSKHIENLGAKITARHKKAQTTEVTPSATKPVDTDTDVDTDMDLLLTIPWFLDHRESNPRRSEFLEFQEKIRKAEAERRKTEAAVVQTVHTECKAISAYQMKLMKRRRKLEAVKVLLDSIKKGDVMSGRKLKAAFMSKVDGETLLETDYERGVRVLCKQHRIRKVGRSYERVR